MKKISFLLCLLILVILSFKPAAHNTCTTLAGDNGWVELINGKDFTGWKASENTPTWSVTDGLFQAVGKRSHLFYEGEHLKDGFKNFEMEVQVKTFRLANSGIYFHTEFQEKGWPNKGIEIQVNNSHIGEGDYIELKKMASLYGLRNIYKSFSKDDEWMTVKARIESNRVQVWLNGLKTVDYIQAEQTSPAVKRLSKGTFALQGHDSLSKMQYKSFRVRRLPDDARSNLPAPVLGAWHDSLVSLQGRQFAFIDLNPTATLSAKELTNYVYSTGINASLVKTPATAKELNAAKNLPLFTGIKVNVKNITTAQIANADYIIGESTDLQTAKALLASNKINIWSDKGKSLYTPDANELLDMAKKNNIAIEIDNEAQGPSVDVIQMAKEKGCRFTFAGLIPAGKMEKSTYVLDAIKQAKLTYKDLYIPKW
ncbi:MAG: family 16 glycoside hydrolase [Chitinophagaceae bacterium]